MLLRAWERQPSLITQSASVALCSYYGQQGQLLPDEDIHYHFVKWARLWIPTGQIAQSAWKEKLKKIEDV